MAEEPTPSERTDERILEKLRTIDLDTLTEVTIEAEARAPDFRDIFRDGFRKQPV